MIRSKNAFTLAEVLITLIVIGIVAAITVPILRNDVADKKWNVARQKAQATIGEAFRLMTVNGEIDTRISTADFVKKVIPKYLKIERTCNPEITDEYKKCGFPSNVKTPSGANVTIPPNQWKWSELSGAGVWNGVSNPVSSGISTHGTFADTYGNTHNKNYFFRTLDGFSVNFFYNPYCAINEKEHYIRFYESSANGMKAYFNMPLDTICLMGIYDMNGNSKPNQVGKDIGFIGSFYNGYGSKSVAVLPHSKEVGGDMSWYDLYRYCENIDKDKNWIMPDLNETSLMAVNYRLLSNDGNSKGISRGFFTRTNINIGTGTMFNISFSNYDASTLGGYTWSGAQGFNGKGVTSNYVRCVRRTELK